MPSHCGNRPTPISVFSDQPRTKSTTSSRTSCGTQFFVKAPQDFFLTRCARPSVRPGLRPWSGLSSPITRSASASPRPDGRDVPSPGRRMLRSQRTPFASDKRRWVAAPVLHTDRKPGPCLRGVASGWLLSLLRCNACALFSYVLSVILTKERSLHFQLRQDICPARPTLSLQVTPRPSGQSVSSPPLDSGASCGRRPGYACQSHPFLA